MFTFSNFNLTVLISRLAYEKTALKFGAVQDHLQVVSLRRKISIYRYPCPKWVERVHQKLDWSIRNLEWGKFPQDNIA